MYDEKYKPDVPGMVMWQYTSGGNIPGINGKVDMNVTFDAASYTPQIQFTETPITVLGKVTATSLNVRKQPSTNSPILSVLKNGTTTPLIASTSNGWYKLFSGGYVSQKYIEYLKATVVNCNKLNVRLTPNSNTNSNIIKAVPVGTQAIVMNHGNGWYQLLFSDGIIGWCSEKYIKER